MRIVLFPSMPHIRNTRRTRKPWTRIFYNTIEHPFPDCISKVLQSDFFSLVNRVFPEPTFVQSPPVRLVIFSTSHVILKMSFPLAKVFATVGRYTWRLPTVNTHFDLFPSCISYCYWRQSKITVRAKAQLNGHEVWYDRTTGLPAFILFWTILRTFFMFYWHVCLMCSIKYRNKYNL